ncbi:MAG: hypothetical protein OEV66_07845 [Spirochaetia bacterium]|nr:hypothetical protein [Spirochaetia bacterium]
MDEELKKNLSIFLVLLETILAGCLVLLAFLYGLWMDASQVVDMNRINWWMVALKRQFIILVAGLIAARLIHTLNIFWINKTGWGSRRNSMIFSTGICILIFLGGLAGAILFVFQRPFE